MGSTTVRSRSSPRSVAPSDPRPVAAPDRPAIAAVRQPPFVAAVDPHCVVSTLRAYRRPSVPAPGSPTCGTTAWTPTRLHSAGTPETADVTAGPRQHRRAGIAGVDGESNARSSSGTLRPKPTWREETVGHTDCGTQRANKPVPRRRATLRHEPHYGDDSGDSISDCPRLKDF
jgi:hypothetical protein